MNPRTRKMQRLIFGPNINIRPKSAKLLDRINQEREALPICPKRHHPFRKLPQHPHRDGVEVIHGNEVTLHLALVALGMSSQCLGVEAGQRVDAKAFLKPKAVVSARPRRNLKHATSSSGRQDQKCGIRHETLLGVMNASETAVRNESLNQYLEGFF